MIDVKLLPKVVIVYFREEARFDYKNNHGCGKLANFALNIMRKINCKMLLVMLYTSL